MSNFLIEGGVKLRGKVNIGGFKNAALAIIPAAILCKEKCIIENVPTIEDVNVFKEILINVGAKVVMLDETTMEIDSSEVKEISMSQFTKNIRASYYMWGAGLGRFNKVTTPFPGGCNIGARKFDYHIKGFEALGAKVVVSEDQTISFSAEKLIGNRIYLDFASVGATINIMLAAVYAEGRTTIENAAKEPHIVDTANFLNAMGADIKGAGTDVIRINGVSELKGCTYSVIPDQIEAGTYMLAAAATKGDIIIDGIIPKHLEPITAKLEEMGMRIEEYGDSLRVFYEKELEPVNIKTLPYPGFPTDLQQPMAVLLSSLNGDSIIEESIFESRFNYVDELRKMGAEIEVNDRIAKIRGKGFLSGASVNAPDLRAGAALIIAGLVAKGVTEINEIYHIDRGYENIENKFMNLGARIKRVI